MLAENLNRQNSKCCLLHTKSVWRPQQNYHSPISCEMTSLYTDMVHCKMTFVTVSVKQSSNILCRHSPWKPASISRDDKQVTYFILWVTMETCINQLWWWASDLFHSVGHHGNLHQSVVMMSKWPISFYGSPWKPASLSCNDEQVNYFILWVTIGKLHQPAPTVKSWQGGKKGETGDKQTGYIVSFGSMGNCISLHQH